MKMLPRERKTGNHSRSYVCCRPLSLPDNLIDLSVSNENISSDIVLESSADSMDSAGFFQRFADHMRAAAGSRDAVYCKGVTDYSFAQSPTVDNSASSVNRSILVQAGFDPAEGGYECPTPEVCENILQPKVCNSGRENRLSAMRVHSVISSSVSVVATPTISASKATSRKRWSDFGTRLVGFVDKMLLPEMDRKPLASQMPSSQHDPRRSGSDERLCSLTAAHAIGRRSAARGLNSQSDASDVIQMYGDIGRLQRNTVQKDKTVTLPQNKLIVTGQMSDDSILRLAHYFSSAVAIF